MNLLSVVVDLQLIALPYTPVYCLYPGNLILPSENKSLSVPVSVSLKQVNKILPKERNTHHNTMTQAFSKLRMQQQPAASNNDDDNNNITCNNNAKARSKTTKHRP
jgi:hypothetical protein